MKISLIGASSFIGKNFIEFLDKKEIEINLVGTQRKKDNTLEHIIKNLSNIRYKQKFLDLTKFENIDYLSDSSLLLFLAGISKPEKRNIEYYNNINLNSLKFIFENNKKLNIKKFIILSSTEAVGKNFSNKPFDELTTPKPDNNYGKNKLQLEKLCGEYSKKGYNINVIRPTTIYGKFDKEFIKFFKLNELRFFPLSCDKECIEYLNAVDLCEGIMKVFKNGVPGEIYNIGPKKKVSLNYILKTIENLSEKKFIKLQIISSILKSLNIKIFDRLTEYKFNSNFNKIFKIGFSDKISLDEGISDLYKHYKKYSIFYK